MLTESIDHYLKAIYELQQQAGKAGTSHLAERLGISPASVTGMIKRLADEDPSLVDYEPHHGVSLTKEGEKAALRIIRIHRLVETFLAITLGYSWDEVHEEADRLEHYISETLEDRIDRLLGNPRFDPHGDPIPGKNGSMPRVNMVPIAGLPENQCAFIRRIMQPEPDLLRYLSNLGIIPDTPVCLIKKDPFEGPLHIRIGVGENAPIHVVGRKIADKIFVEIK